MTELKVRKKKKLNIKKISPKLVSMVCVNKLENIVKRDHGNRYVVLTAYHFILDGTSKLICSYI